MPPIDLTKLMDTKNEEMTPFRKVTIRQWEKSGGGRPHYGLISATLILQLWYKMGRRWDNSHR